MIQYELEFDKNQERFVPVSSDTKKPTKQINIDQKNEHIAVFHWKESDYEHKKLLGMQQFIEDSVKKEGFKVISIPFHEWNRMSMMVECARVQLIKELLHMKVGIKR